jgi:hypothetical protein
MSARIAAYIRQHHLALLCLFLILSGGTAYATHPGGANTIHSGDIIDLEVKGRDLADGSVTTSKINDGAMKSTDIGDGEVRSADVANDTTGGALTGTDIANTDSLGSPEIGGLGSADITDTTRSVDLPLGSFVDLVAQSAIDFNSSNSAPSPDFAIFGGPFIVFDDDSGSEDTGSIGSSFSVPHDFASGGSFAVRLSKDAHTTDVTEHFQCLGGVNPTPNPGETFNLFGDAVEITTVDNTAYTIGNPPSYAAGDSAVVVCKVPQIGPSQDDIVRLHSIEFRYTATQ